MAVAVEAALELAGNGVVNFWLTGNHDVIEDGSGSSVLEPLKSLVDEVMVCDRLGPSSYLLDSAMLCFLPFVATCASYDPAKVVEQVAADADLVARKLVVLSHLNVQGAAPGSETTDMPRGRDVWLPVEAIDRAHATTGKPALVLSGHYHQAQQLFVGSGFPVHVVGSLARLRFDEAHNEPSFLLVEV